MSIILVNKIIKQAYEHSERRFFINRKKEAELFSKLNIFNEQNAIPSLLPLIFSHNKRLAETIAGTIHKILIQIPIDKLEALDEMIRKINYYHPLWNQTTVSTVKNLNLEKSVSNTIYTLLCSHSNGYIREQAIEKLSFEYLELTIPILLIRANDWVVNIQFIASMKLVEIINNNKIKEFLPSLNFVNQLYNKERYDHSVLINAIENKLANECYDNLLDIINSKKDSSRIAFRVASQNLSNLPSLIQAASKSRDIIIKLDLLNIVNQHLFGDVLFEFLCKWVADKSPIIRRKCIYILLERFPNQISHILLQTLFDKTFSLRELARFYLKRNGINNIGKIYQEALISKSTPLHISIMGLAEVGHQDDFKLIEPHMKSVALNVRSACIYAIFKLEPSNKQELILAHLPSSEPMIIKTIYAGLIKNPENFDVDSIEEMLHRKENFNSEMLFIKMKLNIIKDRWNLIEYMLDSIIKYDNDEIKLFLKEKIARWIVANSPNKVFTRPRKIILNSITTKTDELLSENQNDSLYIGLRKSLILFR